MPMFYYKCPLCDFTRGRFFLDIAHRDRAEKGRLIKCINHKDQDMVRDYYRDGPTSQVKEVLDNGFMPKAVERYTDAEKVYDDNSKHPKD